LVKEGKGWVEIGKERRKKQVEDRCGEVRIGVERWGEVRRGEERRCEER
jgi:hypothetical protein